VILAIDVPWAIGMLLKQYITLRFSDTCYAFDYIYQNLKNYADYDVVFRIHFFTNFIYS